MFPGWYPDSSYIRVYGVFSVSDFCVCLSMSFFVICRFRSLTNLVFFEWLREVNGAQYELGLPHFAV